jgi:predicted Zn-dependent protease
MVNGTTAVSINGDQGRSQLTVGPYNNDLNAYVRNVFNALGGQQQQVTPSSIERTTVNGLPAAYGTARVNNAQQQVDVTVLAYEFSNDTAYHFASITPAGQASVFNSLYQSMRRISSSEAGSVVPRRLDIVTAGRGGTVRTLASRMAYTDAQEARFRVLNGLSSREQLVPGREYKIVVRSN